MNSDFLDRYLLLTRQLLNHWFLLVKLKSSLRKFYGCHHSNIWVLKRANVIFYERDMDEDVNMPFHLKISWLGAGETSVSRKIKYIMYNVQSHDVLDNKVVHRATLHTSVDILHTCGKHLHDHII
jgi:hypothetical protein